MPIKPALAAYRSIVHLMVGAPAVARAQRPRQSLQRLDQSRSRAIPVGRDLPCRSDRNRFLMTPSVLLILRGRGVALAQRLLSRTTHGSLAALRQARRCDRGDREAKCNCSSTFVEGEHCYLLC